jgi:TonB family protein
MTNWRNAARKHSGGWVGSRLWLGLCMIAAVGHANAEDAGALAARLHATAAASSIDTPGLVPWHLKVDVQLFDAKGKPAEQGTIEEWWASPDETRVVYTTPSSTVTLLHNKDGLFRTKGQPYPAGILNDLLDQIVRPMPHESEIDSSKPDLRKKSFGKVVLDCIMLDQPLRNVSDPPPLGLFPTFCLDAGEDRLRIAMEIGSLEFVRNTVSTFQKRSVATEVTGGSLDGLHVVSARVSLLSTMQLTGADFAAGSNMEPLAVGPASVSAKIIPGRLLRNVKPDYPNDAMHGDLSGIVKVSVMIGRDGRVEEVDIVSTPNPDLAMPTIAAVRKWVFEPSTLNGVPVETRIEVNVAFGAGVEHPTPPHSNQ